MTEFVRRLQPIVHEPLLVTNSRRTGGENVIRSGFQSMMKSPNFEMSASSQDGGRPIISVELKNCIDRTTLESNGGSYRCSTGRWSIGGRSRYRRQNLQLPYPCSQSWNDNVGLGHRASIAIAVTDFWSMMDMELLLNAIHTAASSVADMHGYWLESAPLVKDENGLDSHKVAVSRDGKEWSANWDDGAWVKTTGEVVSQEEVDNNWTVMTFPRGNQQEGS